MELNVKYVPGTGPARTGHIVLTGLNKPPVIKATSDFFVIGNTSLVKLNTDDQVFKTENEKLRILDMLKDSHQKPAISKETFWDVFDNIDDIRSDIPFDKLHEYEKNIETFFSNRMQIKSHSWIKDKSTLLSPSEQYTIDHGFYESGAEFNWFAKIGKHMQNFGNQVVDNAKRPSNMVESLPYTITIEESVFRFFGLPGCTVESTYGNIHRQYPKYKMDIKYPGLPLTSRTAINVLSITEKNGYKWFLGNNVKNQIIKTNRYPFQSYGLLHTKEMGDFLQVLYMFIWVLLNKNEKYAMTTGDKVVWITCMILSLNSFFAFVEKDKKGVKMRSIKYFQGKEYIVKDARNNFKKEKDKLIKDAEQFLKSMDYLRNNSDILIYIQGIPHQFNSDFYNKIYKDVRHILEELIEYDLPAAYNTPNLIDKHTQELKWNFSIIFFIRGVNRQFKMSHSIKKYTARNHLWSRELIEEYMYIDYGKMSFYELGLLFNRQRLSGGNNTIKGGNYRDLDLKKNSGDKGCYFNLHLSYNFDLNDEELFPNTDYNNIFEDVYFKTLSENVYHLRNDPSVQMDEYIFIPSDEEYDNMESNEKYNYLMQWLLIDIYLLYLMDKSIREFIGDFDMTANILFHWFELNNEVFYLESEQTGLYEVFHSILQDDLQVDFQDRIFTGRSYDQSKYFANQYITEMIQEPQSMPNYETEITQSMPNYETETPRSFFNPKKQSKNATSKKATSKTSNLPWHKKNRKSLKQQPLIIIKKNAKLPHVLSKQSFTIKGIKGGKSKHRKTYKHL